MIVDAGGRPLPNPEIQQRLAQIDPRLTLQWLAWGDKEWWAVMEGWPEQDPRWQRVRSGEIPPDEARDMLCMLPSDCSPDQAYGYLVRTLTANRGKDDWQVLLNRVQEYNRRKQDAVTAEVVEHATEMAAVAASQMNKGSKVFMQFTDKFKKKG